MRLIFVRHGHPDYKNDVLTDLGKIQAEAVRERLKDEKVDEIYTSSSGRAFQTGQYIADMFGLDITKLPFMCEISWGAISGEEIPCGGQPWNVSDFVVSYGGNLMDYDWENGEIFSDNKVCERVKFVVDNFEEWIKTQGYQREGRYYRATETNNKTIVLTSHGGSSTAVLSRLLNLPFPYLCAILHPEFTSVSIIDFHGEKGELFQPRIELLNDYRHIKGCGLKEKVDFNF